MYVSGLKKGADITYGHPGLVLVLRDEVLGGHNMGAPGKTSKRRFETYGDTAKSHV